MVLQPFAHDEFKHSNDSYYEFQNQSSNSIGVYNRGAIICLVCAGFLCPYNVINDDGSWNCIFCNSLNPTFDLLSSSAPSLSSTLREKYKELEHQHINYITNDSFRFNDSSSNFDKYPVHLYAIDSYLCNDDNAISLIYESLKKLANIDGDYFQVCIVICGNRSLNLLRLFDISNGSSDAVSADILPGSSDQSHQITRLIQQGIYATTASILIQKFDMIKGYIVSVVQKSDKDCSTIEAIVGLGATMAELKKGPGVRLLFICSRVFPISKSTEIIVDDGSVLGLSQPKLYSSTSDTAIVYSQLGKYAISKGCYIDVVHASIVGTPKFDVLDALSGATGGCLVTAESYDDDALRATFIKSIIGGASCKNNSYGKYLLKGTVATLEVRTCDKIKLGKFVGPILTGSKEIFFTNRDVIDTINNSSSPTMSGEHINFTINNALNSISNRADYNIPVFNTNSKNWDKMKSEKESIKDNIRKSILSSNDNQVVCGLCRYHLNSHLGLQFNSRVKAAAEDTDAYAQFVIRYKSTDGLSVVRVWTIPFKLTNLLCKFIDVMNERLWSTVTAQIITAEYHDSCIDAFGGASNKALQQNQEELYLRKRSLKSIENLMKTIIDIFLKETDRIHPKLDIIFRFFYHLSEGTISLYHSRNYYMNSNTNNSGPLLDGPALYSQQSALLRSHFLTASPNHASLIVNPLVQLCLIPTNADKDSDLSLANANLLSVSSDTCSLIPNAIALIDTGDSIIVRVGSATINGKSKEYFLKQLINIAAKRVFGRYPCPKFIVLDLPWTGNDRLVFSRLSPSHRDTKEFRLVTVAIKSLISDTQVDEMVTYLSHTDQLTYFMYIWEHIPRYARIYEKYYRTIGAPVCNSMNRDIADNRSLKASYKRKTLFQWITGMKSPDDLHEDSVDEIILSLP